MFSPITGRDLPISPSFIGEIERQGRDTIWPLRLLMNFPNLALHMMITFYLSLFICAMLADRSSASPPLMLIVVVWHLLALPTWFLRRFFIGLCVSPVGILLIFLLIISAVLLLQAQIAIGFENLLRWTREALAQLGQLCRLEALIAK